MKKLFAILVPLLVVACGLACGTSHKDPVLASPDAAPAPPSAVIVPPHRLQNIYDGGFVSGNGTAFYTSGGSGTVTVPAGTRPGVYRSEIAVGASAGTVMGAANFSAGAATTIEMTVR